MRRNARAGVTLLEMLIALWVMAAAAVILSSSLGLTGRALQRVGSEAADVDALAARAVLRRWLEEMPVAARISGDATGMEFGALIDAPPLTAARVERVQVAIEGAALRAVAGDGAVVAELSADGVLVGIRYFGDGAWREAWPATASGLPDAIRIEYLDRGRVVPPLTVIPARRARQSEMSLSSPVPPG
ncbi:MAG: prepilin-type N-terminal cleavage/methylation domain-containing protein [Rhodobacteraceae bacterium]|nr:prepilin-type N-terminal cleavage/methylation domain-containing protein [Paracoccaceae bacterium]